MTSSKIDGDTKLQLGDVVYVVGKPDALNQFERKSRKNKEQSQAI
ncbi:TrkA C-terminal domain-containing protein [Echinicola shivajiensis]|nr:TrkA C-terminal domain-containing protein [Echinicola shivajiensis]